MTSANWADVLQGSGLYDARGRALLPSTLSAAFIFRNLDLSAQTP
jgi:hypothetical protein